MIRFPRITNSDERNNKENKNILNYNPLIRDPLLGWNTVKNIIAIHTFPAIDIRDFEPPTGGVRRERVVTKWRVANITIPSWQL